MTSEEYRADEAAEGVASSRQWTANHLDFRELVEALPQIVWTCDGLGAHDYFNARWLEYTGEEVTDDPDVWKELVHPEDQKRVFATWQHCMATGANYDIDYRFRHSSGEFRWLRVMARPLFDEHGEVRRWYGTSTDIHSVTLATIERGRQQEELRRRAEIDDLTGLLTRRAFFEHAASRAADQPYQALAVLMIDIDHFKTINDAHGHVAGDSVLRDVAQRLKHALPGSSLVARIGGEEFVVLLEAVTPNVARLIAERVLRAVSDDPISISGEGTSVVVTVSIGSCTGPATTSFDQMLNLADQALYHAKDSGRDRHVEAALEH